MQIHIPKKYFEANKEKFAKAFDKEYDSDEGVGETYLIEVEEKDLNFEENSDGSISTYCGSEPGVWVSYDWKDNQDFIIGLLSWAVKRLNKYKSILETLF